MNNIDQIYYINLDHRTDRNKKLLSWLHESGFPSEKIQRIPATYVPNRGYIGCGISHVTALETFLKSPHQNCLILEDDFEPNDVNTIWSKMKPLFEDKIQYDIVMCAYNHKVLKSRTGPTDYLIKVDYTYTTSAYLITREFAPTVIQCFQDTVRNAIHQESITNIRTTEYVIDVQWCNLMPQNRWYGFFPVLGKQAESYSDIDNTYCNHGV